MKQASLLALRKLNYAHILAHGKHPSPTNILLASRVIASEITTRLSHRVMEMNKLPFGLGENQYALAVKGLYATTCQELWNYLDIVNQELSQSKLTNNDVLCQSWMPLIENVTCFS